MPDLPQDQTPYRTLYPPEALSLARGRQAARRRVIDPAVGHARMAAMARIAPRPHAQPIPLEGAA